MRAPHGVYTVFYLLFLAQLVPSLIWIARVSAKRKTHVPIAVLSGSVVVGYLAPPVLNHLTNVWFPSNIPFAYIRAFGMRDPAFDFMGYVLFFAVGGYYVYDLLPRLGARAVVYVAVLAGAADLGYELPFLENQLYDYYGPQQFTIAGFPLHWVALNAAVPVVTGALIHKLVEPTGGRVAWARLAAAPALTASLLLGAVLPVAVTLHADVPDAARAAGSLASGALGLGGIWWAAKYARGVQHLAVGEGRSDVADNREHRLAQ